MHARLPDFTTIEVLLPSEPSLDERYRGIEAAFDSGRGDGGATDDAFARWDAWRAEWRTTAALVRLRFALDTRAEAGRELQGRLDELAPGVERRDQRVKRRLLDPDIRCLLEPRIGSRPFDLWENDLQTFSPAVERDVVREAELCRRYTQLVGSAEATFEGRRLTLGALAPHLQSADGRTRHAAERARWAIFEGAREELDAVFDELVAVRDRIARTLGFANYLELGYRRLRRLDYGPSDVRAWRDEIVRAVVPFAAEFVAHAAAERGFERVYLWDEAGLAANGGVVPLGGPAWIVDEMRAAFAELTPELGAFADLMADHRLYDVETRAGKAPGAFCTSFPAYGVPFVFANAGGARSDVRTIVHEFGHAFASYSSGTNRIADTRSPTYELAEVHSISLEYLTWPQMERFFGERAGDYRRENLADSLLFLPYAAAVDHFQEWAYTHPGVRPSERHEMWRELERRYLPWRNYGDLAHPAMGGLWQEKRHIYLAPLYYIDYTLALCCALQFWERARADRGGAIAAYVALCGRGNDAPFTEAIAGAGLRSPFAAGTLDGVVRAARATLAG